MPNDIADWTGTGAAPQRSLGSFTAPPSQSTSATVTVSPAAHSLAVLFNNIANVVNFSVTGGVSGAVYALIAPVSGVTPGPLFLIPILSVWDTTVTVQVVMGGGAQTATVRLGEIDDPEAVVIQQQGALIVGSTAAGAPVSADVTDRLVRQVGSVIKVDANNHEYEPANGSSFTSGGVVLAGNASAVLIAGIAAQTLTVLAIMEDINVSNSINQYEDTASAVVFAGTIHNTGDTHRHMPTFGLQGPSGAGLQVRNVNNTATGTFWPTVWFRRP